jgi:hypothetical protein
LTTPNETITKGIQTNNENPIDGNAPKRTKYVAVRYNTNLSLVPRPPKSSTKPVITPILNPKLNTNVYILGSKLKINRLTKNKTIPPPLITL